MSVKTVITLLFDICRIYNHNLTLGFSFRIFDSIY